MNGQIFISYRRDDTRWVVNSLYKSLVTVFPREKIFMDIDNIPKGEDFAKVIEQAVSKCNVLLAVIGKDWLTNKDKHGRRRLDNPSDFVRIEIATALKRKIRVIPILVDDAVMPDYNDLPNNLRSLSRRQAVDISYTRFNADVDVLIKSVQELFTQILQDNEKLDLENRRKAQEQIQLNQNEENEKRKIEEQARLKEHEEEIKRKNEERIRLEQLEKEEQRRLAEEKLWTQANSTSTVKSFKKYLSSYPNGKFADDATQKIETINAISEGKIRPPDILISLLIKYWKIITVVIIAIVAGIIVYENLNKPTQPTYTGDLRDSTLVADTVVSDAGKVDTTAFKPQLPAEQPMSAALLDTIKALSNASNLQYYDYFDEMINQIELAPKSQKDSPSVQEFVKKYRIAKAKSDLKK